MNNAESGIRVRDGEDVIISPVGALLNQRNVIHIHDMGTTRRIFYCDEFRHNGIIACQLSSSRIMSRHAHEFRQYEHIQSQGVTLAGSPFLFK